MEQKEVLKHVERYRGSMEKLSEEARRPLVGHGKLSARGAKAEVCEFLKKYAGAKSSFFREASAVAGVDYYQYAQLASVLSSFASYLKAGLADEVAPERRVQLDVVSDFLDLAHRLLEDKSGHPAAAAMLIGATLEEFLRTWVEGIPLSLGNRKPGIQAYADLLRAADVITTQDIKDITSWAGIRNHAAHGDWVEVSDRQRIKIMLESINLFMRRYSGA